MTHSVISHDNFLSTNKNNTFNINSTPFFDAWKSTVLAQAKLLGIPYNNFDTASIDLKELNTKIEARFTHSGSALSNLKHIVNSEDTVCVTANNGDKELEVPSYYLCDEYVELCNKYHIPYKRVYHNYRELEAAEELVADYMDLLKTAKNLCIYWDTSKYDPEGLEEAIDEYHSEESDHEYFADLRSDTWAYYSKLGV